MPGVRDRLADEWGRDTLPRTVLEAVVVEAYGQALLSQGEVGTLPGTTFAQTEDLLPGRGVPLHYNLDDYEPDRWANLKLCA